MNHEHRAKWEQRHRDSLPGDAEISVGELLPEIQSIHPHGRVLDIAAGTGRNALAVARAGLPIVAIDFSAPGMRTLAEIARREGLLVCPIVADLEAGLPVREKTFDVILNVSYLDRALVPQLKAALRPGGLLLFDTFTVDEAGGHLRDTRFALERYELRAMLADMELMRYREGLTIYPSGKRMWRAAALARRKG